MKIKKKVYALVFVFVAAGALVAQYTAPNMDELFNGSIADIAYQSDGKIIVVGGFDGHIARLKSEFSVDTVFSSEAEDQLFNDEVKSVVVNSNDDILVGGSFTNFNQSIVGHFAKLDANGNIDEDFLRKMGTGFDDKVNDIALQSDGKIIVVGDFNNYNGEYAAHIIRLNTDGSFDKTFQIGDGFDNPVNTISLAESGDISFGGHFTAYQGQPAPYYVTLSNSGERK